MWQCLKLPRFSIQTTEKLFMPNVMIVTFDSNTVYGARDSRPAGSWYVGVLTYSDDWILRTPELGIISGPHRIRIT